MIKNYRVCVLKENIGECYLYHGMETTSYPEEQIGSRPAGQITFDRAIIEDGKGNLHKVPVSSIRFADTKEIVDTEIKYKVVDGKILHTFPLED